MWAKARTILTFAGLSFVGVVILLSCYFVDRRAVRENSDTSLKNQTLSINVLTNLGKTLDSSNAVVAKAETALAANTAVTAKTEAALSANTAAMTSMTDGFAKLVEAINANSKVLGESVPKVQEAAQQTVNKAVEQTNASNAEVLRQLGVIKASIQVTPTNIPPPPPVASPHSTAGIDPTAPAFSGPASAHGGAPIKSSMVKEKWARYEVDRDVDSKEFPADKARTNRIRLEKTEAVTMTQYFSSWSRERRKASSVIPANEGYTVFSDASTVTFRSSAKFVVWERID